MPSSRKLLVCAKLTSGTRPNHQEGKSGRSAARQTHRFIHNFPRIDLFPVFGGDVKKTHQHAVEEHLPLAGIPYDIGFAANADPTNHVDCEFKSGTEGEINKRWNDLETSRSEERSVGK